MDLKLSGKRALVTGASAGIGASIAKQLAAEGAKVVVHGRNAERTDKIAADIRNSGGEAATALGDLTSEAGADQAAETALSAWGGIDILINNAGGPSNPGLNWKNISSQDWLNSFELNVLSTTRMISRCLPSMKEGGWGRLIQCSSMIAIKPGTTIPDYSTAKAMMPTLSMSLAQELTGTGITVNSVSPGLVLTQVLKDYFNSLPENAGRSWDEIESELAIGWNSCTGSIATTEDIATAVTFLASPLAGHITGINLRIDGGMHGTTN